MTKDRVVGCNMGTGSRVNLVGKESIAMPGPGNYTKEGDTFGKDVKSFTIGEKHKEM